MTYFLNPFTFDSAHHRPIGTGAIYAAAGHASTIAWQQANRIAINTANDTPWGTYVVQATNADPLKTITWNNEHTGQNLPITIRVPNSLASSPGATGGFEDNVVVIFNTDNQTAYEFFKFMWNGGNPKAAILRTYALNGLGHGTSPGQRIGVSASGVSMMFGTLRGWEVNAAGHTIGHALQLALPFVDGVNPMISKQIILPATTKDGSADNADRANGPIPYGGLLAIPPSVNLNALGLSEPGLRMAQAIRDYGMYAVDATHGGLPNMRADQGFTSGLRSTLIDDTQKFHMHVRLVLNSAWTPGQAAVGGGTPLAANLAEDAGGTTPPPTATQMPTSMGVIVRAINAT